MLRKAKSARTLWTLLLVGIFLLGLFGSGSLAAPEEPQWRTLDAADVDQGPGWPQGWVPPAAPTAISPERQAEYDEIISGLPAAERPARLEFRVQPLPSWTSQFPYHWKYDFSVCETTAYLFYYPYPDMELVSQMTTQKYAATEGPSSDECGSFYQILSIKKPIEATPEEREEWRLYEKQVESRRLARKGLDWCSEGSSNSPESILVCFNEGEASALFDVPAYLDTTVSRVRVPVRFVSELMGADVKWNETTRQVTIDFPLLSADIVKIVSSPGHTTADWYDPGTDHSISENIDYREVTIAQSPHRIVLTIGETTAYVDGNPITIDAPPVIKGDRTMVPIRFISEELGAKVYWVGKDPIFPAYETLMGTYQVHIYTPFHPWYDNPSWFLENRAVKS